MKMYPRPHMYVYVNVMAVFQLAASTTKGLRRKVGLSTKEGRLSVHPSVSLSGNKR